MDGVASASEAMTHSLPERTRLRRTPVSRRRARAQAARHTVAGMRYTTLGTSGTVVSTLVPRHDDLRRRGRRGDVAARSWRPTSRPAATSSTPPTSTASGVSEEIIGRWLADPPDGRDASVVIATKGRFPMGDGPNDLGLSRRHLRRALDDSLRRLGVEHIDLYQMHAWDAVTPIEETLRFLDDAVSAGKIALLRLLQLPRLAGHQGGPHGAGARLDRRR